jgi:hypothetical protein
MFDMRRFVVKGSGNFPVSMLALCECWPASMQEAEKLSYALPTQAPEQVIAFASERMLTGDLIHSWKMAAWPVQRIE